MKVLVYSRGILLFVSITTPFNKHIQVLFIIKYGEFYFLKREYNILHFLFTHKKTKLNRLAWEGD